MRLFLALTVVSIFAKQPMTSVQIFAGKAKISIFRRKGWAVRRGNGAGDTVEPVDLEIHSPPSFVTPLSQSCLNHTV